MSEKSKIRPEEITVYMVGHSHLDLAWLWTWEETKRDILPNTWEATLRQMDSMPGLTFAASQMAFYEAIEESRPDLLRRIREKAAAGLWGVVGGMWVEMDANMPCGESMVRQALLGQQYARETFGIRCTVAYLPDTFGQAWTLPQILKKAGFEHFLFMRCAPEGMDCFWWESPDGSRVLAGKMLWCMDISSEDFDFTKTIVDYAERTGMKEILFFFGKGDHGGGLRPKEVAKIREWQEYSAEAAANPAKAGSEGHPKIDFILPHKFMDRVKRSGAELPVYRGELNPTFPGCYTTQARIKELNRRLETLLLDAEKISALANFYHKVTRRLRSFYPWRPLHEAWKIVLRNQFHDILPGSSTPAAVREAIRGYEEAEAHAQGVLREGLELVAGRVDTLGEGTPVVVFNTLSWERSGPAEVELHAQGEKLAARDWEGNVRPCQVVSADEKRGTVRVLFDAKDVPSMGYAAFHIVRGEEESESEELKVTRGALENRFLRATLDPATGHVKEIFHKELGRNTLAEPGNRLEMIGDEPERMDAWKMELTDEVEEPEMVEAPRVVEAGPVRAKVRFTKACRDSWFDQEIILHADTPRLDFRMTAHWYERRRCLKVAFTANVESGEATFEIPYGSIVRPADGTEYPALRWVDVSDGQMGLSILSRSKYGFDVNGKRMRMTLLRGSTTPDPMADMGEHVIEYAVFPHAGRWGEGGTVRRGYEFNTALHAIQAMKYKGVIPSRAPTAEVSPANLIISAIKQEEGYAGKRMVMRVYETEGKETEGEVRFPIPVRAWEANLLEEAAGLVAEGAGPIRLSFRPHEIKTLLLESLEEGAGTEIYE